MATTRALRRVIEGDKRLSLDDYLASTQPLELLNFLFAFADGTGSILVGQKKSIIRHPGADTVDQIGVLLLEPALAHACLGALLR